MNDTKAEDFNQQWEEVQADNAEAAMTEYENDGVTKRRCLKCGGQFRFQTSRSGYTVWCENNDYKMTVRGI